MVVVVAVGTKVVAERGPVARGLAKPPGPLFQSVFTHDAPLEAFVAGSGLMLALCAQSAGNWLYLAGGHVLAAAQLPHSSTT